MGLGGIGKTTLAKQFFNRKKSDYLKSCFLFEVKENAAKGSLNSLQRELFKSLTGSDKQVNNVDEGKEILKKPLKSSNQSSKSLSNLQIRALLPVKSHQDIHSGSLILITSRDKGVLIRSRVERSSIYMLTGLSRQHSRELFCSHAFSSQDSLPGTEYEYLIDKFLESCNGLPLSLKVLGAYLYGKEISEWRDELGSLPSEVKERLKISYDALDTEEQRIILDIACFLRRENRDTAISIWDGSGWKGRRGFQNLQDRCLVEVDSQNVIHMHEHLRDLGGDVAEKSSPFRLWRWKQNVVDDFLQQQSSVISVRGLKMDLSEYNNYDYVLSRISTMRLQILDTEGVVLERILGRVELPEILWLRWIKCPYSSLPSWIPLKNLRHLDVSGSDLNTLWESESESQVPFQLAEFLEVLITESCVKLKSIPGLGYYTKLRTLDVNGCSELEELPSMEKLESIEEFYAFGCVKLKSIRGFEQWAKLPVLNVRECSELEELPSMETLVSMEEFCTEECVKLKSIPGLEQWAKLLLLNIVGCSELESLPNMEALVSMEEFYAHGCVKLKSIRGLQQCTKLRLFDVDWSSELDEHTRDIALDKAKCCFVL